jgi:hypothetical protein
MKTDRYKTNKNDPPLTKNGLKLANEKINTMLLNINNEDLGFIYSSPFMRCIQTALEFQKVIKKKYKILIPIKIEYGLISNVANYWYIYYPNAKVNIKNNKIEYVKDSAKFIDDEIENKSTFEKYGQDKFDLKYKSIASINSINNESSMVNKINKTFNVIEKISNKLDFTKFNIVCTHGENIAYTKSFIENKWKYDNSSLFSGLKWCAYMKLNKINDELVIEEIGE